MYWICPAVKPQKIRHPPSKQISQDQLHSIPIVQTILFQSSEANSALNTPCERPALGKDASGECTIL